MVRGILTNKASYFEEVRRFSGYGERYKTSYFDKKNDVFSDAVCCVLYAVCIQGACARALHWGDCGASARSHIE
jgi:hypothetical protein